MYINQEEKKKLYQGLELFKSAFSSYIVSVLSRGSGDDWRNDFVKSLSPAQLQFWEEREREGKNPEDLIDFQHLKYFAIKNKDLLRDDFKKKTDRLPTLLEEIVDVRNSYAHFDEIEDDEAKKAWINMRSIARFIGNSELEQQFSDLENRKSEDKKTSPKTETVSQKPETHSYKNPVISSDGSPPEILDIVNCAGDDFRKTVFSHNVYLCPVKGRVYKHKRCKYLGIYWQKHVGAVSEIEAVIDVYNENAAQVYFINGDEPDDVYTSRAKKLALELRPEHLPLRVFLLKKLHSTDFIKDSSGGMFGTKMYLDVENLEAKNAEDLAAKLHGKNYSEFWL